MSDVLEELRASEDGWFSRFPEDLRKMAADEIERQRFVIENLQAMIDWQKFDDCVAETGRRIDARIDEIVAADLLSDGALLEQD